MSSPLQEFLADATLRAADNLAQALGRIPEEKRSWSPEGKARTAFDLVAECAVLNAYTIHTMQTGGFSPDSMATYLPDKDAAIAAGSEKLIAQLKENAARVAEVIRTFPAERLEETVQMPWGTMRQSEIISYPFWNMSYHEGQVNYIASMLGCLD